jgi:hypothetical protein
LLLAAVVVVVVVAFHWPAVVVVAVGLDLGFIQVLKWEQVLPLLLATAGLLAPATTAQMAMRVELAEHHPLIPSEQD